MLIYTTRKIHFSSSWQPPISSSTNAHGQLPPHSQHRSHRFAHHAPSSARFRNLKHPQSRPPILFHRISGCQRHPLPASCATSMPPRSRSWRVAAYHFKTSYRASWDPSLYSPYTVRPLNDPGPIKINSRAAHSTTSRNADYRSPRLQHHKIGT